jgi:hypothetical protein
MELQHMEIKASQPLNSKNSVAIHTIQSETPTEIHHPLISTEVQQQLSLGGIAIATMFCLVLLLREIRRLVEACKG